MLRPRPMRITWAPSYSETLGNLTLSCKLNYIGSNWHGRMARLLFLQSPLFYCFPISSTMYGIYTYIYTVYWYLTHTHIYIYTYTSTTYTEREIYIYVYTYTLACTRTLLVKTHKQGIGLLICYLDRDTSGRRLRVATASNHLRREGHVERCSRDTKHTARLMSFEFWHKDP